MIVIVDSWVAIWVFINLPVIACQTTTYVGQHYKYYYWELVLVVLVVVSEEQLRRGEKGWRFIIIIVNPPVSWIQLTININTLSMFMFVVLIVIRIAVNNGKITPISSLLLLTTPTTLTTTTAIDLSFLKHHWIDSKLLLFWHNLRVG